MKLLHIAFPQSLSVCNPSRHACIVIALHHVFPLVKQFASQFGFARNQIQTSLTHKVRKNQRVSRPMHKPVGYRELKQLKKCVVCLINMYACWTPSCTSVAFGEAMAEYRMHKSRTSFNYFILSIDYMDPTALQCNAVPHRSDNDELFLVAF